MTVVAIMGRSFSIFGLTLSRHTKKISSSKRILDLGCGTGRFSAALRARFEAEVIGIDPSKKMLEQARSFFPPVSHRDTENTEKDEITERTSLLAFLRQRSLALESSDTPAPTFWNPPEMEDW